MPLVKIHYRGSSTFLYLSKRISWESKHVYSQLVCLKLNIDMNILLTQTICMSRMFKIVWLSASHYRNWVEINWIHYVCDAKDTKYFAFQISKITLTLTFVNSLCIYIWILFIIRVYGIFVVCEIKQFFFASILFLF